MFLPDFFETKFLLFTSQFSVEAAQTDRESLKRGKRISVIHGEHVFAYFPELEDDFILI